jgi:hypothetical protein
LPPFFKQAGQDPNRKNTGAGIISLFQSVKGFEEKRSLSGDLSDLHVCVCALTASGEIPEASHYVSEATCLFAIRYSRAIQVRQLETLE